MPWERLRLGKPVGELPSTRPTRAAGDPPCAILLHDAAVSTSGNSKQFIEVSGKRFSHIIDPSTGLGLEGAASTTVIARDSTTADALATALSVMPVGRWNPSC